MGTVNIRTSDIPVIDSVTADDVVKGYGRAAAASGRGRNMTNAANYIMGVLAETAGEFDIQAKVLAEDNGVSEATISKARKVARTVRYFARDVEDTVREDLDDQHANLAAYWSLFWAVADGDAPGYLETCRALVGADGDARREAVAMFCRVFGAPSSAYNVAQGKAFHPDDERADVSDGDGEVGVEGEQGDDGAPTPWQQLVTAAVTQAQHQGASVSEVVAHVSNLFKS